jgi:hypothetical protein
MKIRTGFVSNSSSASFSIKLSDLEDWQLLAILTNDYSDSDWMESWDSIYVDKKKQTVEGYTTMDNYDMYTFLTTKLNIPGDVIEWEKDG